MSDVWEMLFDNPILTKHVRSRLRPGQALPWAAVVVVLCSSVVWASLQVNWMLSSRAAVMMLLGLQILMLAVGGARQINGSLGGVRESGIIDFHRVSPLSPAAVSLGFFLGAPIREYAIAAITVPFAFFIGFSLDAFDSWRGVRWITKLELAILATAWLVHAMTMLSCLTRKVGRGSIAGTIGLLFLLLIIGYISSIGIFVGMGWLLDDDPKLNFLGIGIPWLPWLLGYELPALAFISLAVVRKMRTERAHAFSKTQALACMGTATFLVLGGLWGVARMLQPSIPMEPTSADAIMIASVYVLALLAMVLSITITPDASEYAKGMRRAIREGKRRATLWADAASNRPVLFGLSVFVLLGATLISSVVGRQPFRPPVDVGGTEWWTTQPSYISAENQTDAAWLATRQSMMTRPIAISVLTVAYVGLALQFFSLRTRQYGTTLLALFLFVAWFVPLLAGAIVAMGGTSASENSSLVILSLSPLPGIALSSGLGKPVSADAIQLAALAPPITFAFIFNYLLVITQRKTDRRLIEQEKEANPGLALLSDQASGPENPHPLDAP